MCGWQEMDGFRHEVFMSVRMGEWAMCCSCIGAESDMQLSGRICGLGWVGGVHEQTSQLHVQLSVGCGVKSMYGRMHACMINNQPLHAGLHLAELQLSSRNTSGSDSGGNALTRTMSLLHSL